MILFLLSTSNVNLHPTGQKVQTEDTFFTALSHLYLRSTKAPVGHTSIHAPQNSQPDSIKDDPLAVPIKVLPDLSNKVIALSPLTSSHTLTHLTQAIHKFISISQNGSVVCKGILRLL